MSSPLLAPSRPASRSSIRETTTSRTASPAPFPLHPSNAQAQARADARARSPTGSSTADENADPFLVAKPVGGLPFEKPTHPTSSTSGIPRKPRLSLTGPTPAAAKDIIHRGVGAGAGSNGPGGGGGGHMKRLSTGSLRGESVDAGARVENLEIRVRNYKMDCIGLAKDILGLCEENAASKAWIRELAVALDGVATESKNSRVRLDEYVELYDYLKAQHKDQNAHDADRVATKSTIEWQSLIIQDLLEEKKRRLQEEATRAQREEQLEAQVRMLLERDAQRHADVERLTDRLGQRVTPSAVDASLADVGGAGMMEGLLARIAELERSFADSTLRMDPAPLVSPSVAPVPKRAHKSSDNSTGSSTTSEGQKERELARLLDKGRREAKEKEARMQALLGEALERNLVLAARVRELEAHKSMAASAAAEATSAFGLAPTHAASSAGASIADTLFATQTPAPARNGLHPSRAADHPAKEAQTPAPSLPALDPMSPFVLDRTVRRGERLAAASKGGPRPPSGLRE